MSPDTHSLVPFLDCAVPLEIHALTMQGGPDGADIEAARAFGSDLALRGDVMLFSGGKPGEAGELASQTARSIAVLAFCPGGVTLFGRTWAAGALNDTAEHDAEVRGMYYTPASVLAIIEPQAGSGAWLGELAQNPPWGQS